ncbi:MAG: HrcA family transcriptional regulator, partial [Lachnospiraceae bacterium]|nr:HrcA family transcriptional regulator [Lachnospiraceae bacterium]
YRIYVDDMLRSRTEEVEQMREVLVEREDRLESLLQQVAKLLANNTQYTSMISAPMMQQNRIKFIQLSQVDENNVLAVIMIEGNQVRSTLIHVDEELGAEALLKLNMLLNSNLSGLSVEQINLGLIAAIRQQAGEHAEMISQVIEAAAQAIRPDEDLKIYTSGAKNIFRYPELADHQKASRLISDLEEKQALGSIVQETLESDDNGPGIQIYIGNEMQVASMQDCSVVTATYELGDGMRGTVGIIGPKRMDYDRVVGVLRDIMKQLDDLYKN